VPDTRSKRRLGVTRTRQIATILVPALGIALAGCAARSPATRSAPRSGVLEVREGLASYYGEAFHGKRTASGAPFDMRAMVAAHPSYPFGTIVRVTNLSNGRTAQVRILDRGPASGPRAAGVVIDVSYGAAEALGFVQQGRTRVRLEVLRWGK
jgi:rare lipoprotein A